MKDTYYFSHDYNSRTDPKIKKMLVKHKMIGYGIYWAIIEDLYNNANALPLDYDTIAFDLHADNKLVESIINDFDLFVFEGDTFGSLGVQKRLEERAEKSKKARESAYKRWKKDANAMQSQCEPNAIKERKEKKKKEKVFIAPTISDIENYAIQSGYKIDASNIWHYYNDANWHDSKGNKIKNWKQKVRGVWFKPENKIKERRVTC